MVFSLIYRPTSNPKIQSVREVVCQFSCNLCQAPQRSKRFPARFPAGWVRSVFVSDEVGSLDERAEEFSHGRDLGIEHPSPSLTFTPAPIASVDTFNALGIYLREKK
jgi:hypothetical protein